MKEIRNAFADKNFDDEALQFIDDFINEFDDLFGKYVSRDEVIRRIKENLDTIVLAYEFEKTNILGEFIGGKKEIRLARIEDKDKLKGVFFHEMIHCITRNNEKNTTCFSKSKYVMDLGNMEIVTCHGLTEGFTQYVTLIRNAKYVPNTTSLAYPILAEQVGNLIELIGEEGFLDIAFNRPDDIGDVLEFENKEWEMEDFLNAFDDIWIAEDTIIKQKQERTATEELLKAIFGR